MRLLSASSGCGRPTVGVSSSHMVKFDRLRAVGSTSVLMVGDTMRTDSWGWFWEVMSWEKDPCKAGEDDSSALRRSGDASDSTERSVWGSEGEETLGSPLAGCSSGEVGTWCSGR